MRVFSIAFSIALIMAVLPVKKQKVIFFGDSITEAGAKKGGYILKIDSMSSKEGKQNDYEFIGAGIGGNKVYDLYLRMEKDVLEQKPDVVVIYIGVNDVWHKKWGTGTDYDKFGRFYEALVKKIQSIGARVIVCTPAVIGERTDFSNELDGDLNAYSNWIRQFASDNKLELVDLRKEFLAYNLTNNKTNAEKGILTTDRVHLNEAGNQLVADLMWKHLKK